MMVPVLYFYFACFHIHVSSSSQLFTYYHQPYPEYPYSYLFCDIKHYVIWSLMMMTAVVTVHTIHTVGWLAMVLQLLQQLFW